jgi:hypothetical protein
MTSPIHLRTRILLPLLAWALSAQAFGQGIDMPLFLDVSADAGIAAPHRAVWDPVGAGRGYLAVGQAWGDYDNDGFVDLFVTGNLAANTRYHNRGDGSFERSALVDQVAMPNATTGGAVWADYDNDGWRDLYVVAFGRNALLRNDSGNGFRDVTALAGVGDTGKGTSATWGDYNSDGLLDLYLVNWSCLPECYPEDVALSRDRLYRNLGDGSFRDVSFELDPTLLQGAGFAATFVDVDNDGDADIYVVNDRMTNPIGNILWRNDGPGCGSWCWAEIAAEVGANAKLHGMGLAVGDIDNDADQELFVTSMMTPMLLLDNSDGSFVDSTLRAGVGVNPPGHASAWGTAFFDVDNDGWLDLYLAATGLPPGPSGFLKGSAPDMEDFRNPYPDLLFRNNGDGTFTDLGETALGENLRPTMGLAYADYDNDGFVDFVVGHWNEGYALFRNVGQAGADNGWLTVRLVGNGPVNRDAIGSRVYLQLDNGTTLMQEVMAGSSLGAGNDTALHFGCGGAAITALTVVWPNGVQQTFTEVTTDQNLRIVYGGPS